MSIRSIVPRSLRAKILAGILAAVLAYFLWQWSSASGPPGTERQADTSCLASRVGLPCNPDF